MSDYIGRKYVVIFFYPKDFTFVCPTELFAFQEKLDEFEKRNVQVIACSTDTEQSHWGWLNMDKNIGGVKGCLLYTSPSPRDRTRSRMPSSA